MLLMARLIASLCQGTYFGVGAVVAGSLMPPGRQAGAVAAMFMGLTIANVLGVPAATWLGETLSWRATFWSMVVVGLVSIVALRSTLPAIAPSKRKRIGRIVGTQTRTGACSNGADGADFQCAIHGINLHLTHFADRKWRVRTIHHCNADNLWCRDVCRKLDWW